MLNAYAPLAQSPRVAHLWLALLVGCWDLPEYYGPLCDKAATHDWSPAIQQPEMDHIDHFRWPSDPALEERLRGYGMDDSWDLLSGQDVADDGIVVSPYGKTLNAYELIAATSGMEGWAQTLATGYPVHGSCGEKAPGILAATWKGRSGHRIDLYSGFYDINVVSRAGFLVHEAAHAAGAPNHINDQDESWEVHGAYRLQAEFMAALYHADGVSEEHRDAALAEFTWIVRDKFIEPVILTIEDFRP